MWLTTVKLSSAPSREQGKMTEWKGTLSLPRKLYSSTYRTGVKQVNVNRYTHVQLHLQNRCKTVKVNQYTHVQVRIIYWDKAHQLISMGQGMSPNFVIRKCILQIQGKIFIYEGIIVRWLPVWGFVRWLYIWGLVRGLPVWGFVRGLPVWGFSTIAPICRCMRRWLRCIQWGRQTTHRIPATGNEQWKINITRKNSTFIEYY